MSLQAIETGKVIIINFPRKQIIEILFPLLLIG